MVAFEETNLLGNVYYVNHLSWQGRCRELFLRDHVPELLNEFSAGLRLVTTRCSCEYLCELFPFEEIAVRMHLAELAQNRLTLGFEYWRRHGESEELVARGEQQVLVMRQDGERVLQVPLPPALREALRPYEKS